MTYTEASYCFDYTSPEIQKLILPYQNATMTKGEISAALYLKVRDGWRYNPYRISFKPAHHQASYIARQKEGHCIDKSILLIACLRGLHIPARLQLAKVQNHIAVERLQEKFGTNVMTPHGMVNIFLDGSWLKASPAFNRELCERCQVAPLNFDGTKDSVFQEYNLKEEKFMEYLEDYGHFPDVPLDFIRENITDHYPGLMTHLGPDDVWQLPR